jgi:DsbC/DsbD-like thiol-disulfide interchange protein
MIARMPPRFLRLALLMAAAATPLAAQQSLHAAQQVAPHAAQHATVTLVAERTAAVAGQPLTVGVHFELDPHWHIYWRNPGDSGGPPTIEWKLPEGFQAAAFEWPTPQRIPIGGTLVNYGYESDVLLPLTVHVPASAKPGMQMDLIGHVKYLICSDLCVPAKADVMLAMPIAAAAASAVGSSGIGSSAAGSSAAGSSAAGSSAGAHAPSASARLFAQTRNRIPKPAPSTWTVHGTYANRQFDLAIDTGTRETSAQFFPLAPSQIDDSSPQQVTPTARGMRLTLHASDQLTAAPRTLSGLLVLSDSRAFTIDAPVTSRSEQQQRKPRQQ